jgi:predicted nucleotidyltransferase
MELSRHYIIEYLKNHKDEYNQKYSIDEIAIFGSFAKEKNNLDSDIDIVYSTSKNLTFREILELEEELNGAFDRDIDLVNIKQMNPLIKRKILKELVYV